MRVPPLYTLIHIEYSSVQIRYNYDLVFIEKDRATNP